MKRETGTAPKRNKENLPTPLSRVYRGIVCIGADDRPCRARNDSLRAVSQGLSFRARPRVVEGDLQAQSARPMRAVHQMASFR